MIEEDLFEQEIQKKKRRVLILLICLFVLAGGGFIAQRDALVEEIIEEGTATPVPVAHVASQPTPTETPTPQETGPEVSEVSRTPTSTPTVEEATPTQTIEDTATAIVADGVGGPTGTNQEMPVNNTTDETGTEDGEPQTGGQIGADRDAGDEVTSDDTGAGVSEEPTTVSEDTPASDVGVDDIGGESENSGQTGAGVSPADEDQLEDMEETSTTDEADIEGKTVEQDSAQGQESDFQPPPVQLPVTGSTILNWNVAPVVAVSLLVFLVGAGAISLFSKHRRY